MNDEERTAVLLSGAATDLEQVAALRRDDMTSEEWTELSEIVARLKDLHETLAYESELREVPPRVPLVSPEADPETPEEVLKEAIRALDDGDGARREDAIRTATAGAEIVESAAQDALDSLEKRGEVYKCNPDENRYRVTDDL